MKKFIRRSTFLLLFMTCSLFALAQGIIDNVAGAIGSGNVGVITRYFDNAVAMTIVGGQSTYSKSQAEMVLKDFFGKNTPKGFSIEHSGGSNGNNYAIGTLNTTSGRFRAYFAVKQKDGNYFIREIRIEK